MEASVAVIGLGRVGLPLALSFADRGLRTIGVERQQAVLDQLAARQMPFSETGTQELLGRVMESGHLELTRFVATMLVELIAVQRLSALGARCKCRPGLVHIHIPLKTFGSSVYSGISALATADTRADDRAVEKGGPDVCACRSI